MIDRDYPRMLFHRTEPAVTVYSQVEEEALGPGWSRTILAQQPDQEEEPDDDEEEPEPEDTPQPAESVPAARKQRHR